jgi:hypothetical protein
MKPSVGRLSSLPTFHIVIAGWRRLDTSEISWFLMSSQSRSVIARSSGAWSGEPAITVMLYARHLSRKSVWSLRLSMT